MSREREVVFLFIPLLCKKRPGEGENNATTFSVDKNVTTMCIRCSRWTWRIVLRFLFKVQRDECRRRCLSAESCPAPSVSFRFFRFISLHVELTNVKEGKFRGSLFAFRVRNKNGFPILSIFHFLHGIPLRFFVRRIWWTRYKRLVRDISFSFPFRKFI